MSFLSSQSLGIYKGVSIGSPTRRRHFKRPSPEFTSMEDDCTKKAMYAEFPLAFFLRLQEKKHKIDYMIIMFWCIFHVFVDSLLF